MHENLDSLPTDMAADTVEVSESQMSELRNSFPEAKEEELRAMLITCDHDLEAAFEELFASHKACPTPAPRPLMIQPKRRPSARPATDDEADASSQNTSPVKAVRSGAAAIAMDDDDDDDDNDSSAKATTNKRPSSHTNGDDSNDGWLDANGRGNGQAPLAKRPARKPTSPTAPEAP
jgi:hypothetical protein